MTDGVPQWEVSNSSPSVLGEAVLLGGDDQVYFAWLAFPGTCFFPLSLSPASGHCICHLRTFQGEEEGSSSCLKQRLESNLPCLVAKLSQSVQGWEQTHLPLAKTWGKAGAQRVTAAHNTLCPSLTQVPRHCCWFCSLTTWLLAWGPPMTPTLPSDPRGFCLSCSVVPWNFGLGRFCSSWEAILGGECSIVPCDPPCTTCQAQWVSLDHLIQKCPPRWNYASSRFLF